MILTQRVILASFLSCFIQAVHAQEPASSENATQPSAASPQEKPDSPSWMPENFHNKTIVLNYDEAICYHLTRVDGGWQWFGSGEDGYPRKIVFKDKDETFIKWPQPTYDGVFYIKKLNDHSFALTGVPEIDNKADIMCDEHVSCFQFSLTSENEGVACLTTSSFAGTNLYTNIKFIIKNN